MKSDSTARPPNKALALVAIGSILLGMRFVSERSSLCFQEKKESLYISNQQFSNIQSNSGSSLDPSSTSSTSSDAPSTSSLPPVHWHSSWLGNQWIPPPGYHTYSPTELLELFSNYSILVVGDSTSRRTYSTWNALLQEEAASSQTKNTNETASENPNSQSRGTIINTEPINNAQVIDQGKMGYFCPQNPDLTFCNPYYPTSNEKNSTNDTRDSENNRHNQNQRTPSLDLLYHGYSCLFSLADALENPQSTMRKLLPNYDMVVFILGPWETDTTRYECQSNLFGRRNSTDRIVKAIENIANNNDQSSSTMILWRTWSGYGATYRDENSARKTWAYAQAHNYYIKRKVWEQQQISTDTAQGLQIIDWGHIMSPRSWPESVRISGDIDPHFGLEARVAFVQMVANHLVKQQRQQELNLPQWKSPLQDPADDCLASGMAHKYCLTKEERDQILPAFVNLSPPQINYTQNELEELATRQKLFCRNCIWQGKVSCAKRFSFVTRKATDVLAGFRHTMGSNTCNSSEIPEFH